MSPDNTPGHPAAHGVGLSPAKPTNEQSTTSGVERLLCQTAHTNARSSSWPGRVFATMLGNGMVMPFIPVYVAQFGLGGLGAGLLFSVHAATRTVLLPFIGRASGPLGQTQLSCWSGVLFYALGPPWPIPWPTGSRPLSALWRSTVRAWPSSHLVSMAYVGDLAPRGEEGRYSGYMNNRPVGRDCQRASPGGSPPRPVFHVGQLPDDECHERGVFSVAGGPAASCRIHPDRDRKNPSQPPPGPGQLLSCRPVVGVASFRLAYACTNALIWIFLPVLAARLWALIHDADRGVNLRQRDGQHRAASSLRPAGRPQAEGRADCPGRSRQRACPGRRSRLRPCSGRCWPSMSV